MPFSKAKLSLWVWGVRTVLRHRRPDVALAFLGGLGDELLCTAPLVEWRQRGARNIWIRTHRPELFAGLDRAAQILPDSARCDRLASRLGRPFRYLSYSRYDEAGDRDEPLARHVIAEMCARAGLTGAVTLRPHWRVSATERARAAAWHDCIAINTSTLVARVPMLNKQWPAARFQAVVDHFGSRFKFVQLGAPADPPLRGTTDLRGQTSLRETAAILHGCRAFIGLVGFLMHLARAVECPAAIVYGGREPPELTGYPCNENVALRPACAPCWQRSRCEHDHACMAEIDAARVIAAVERVLTRPRGPLLESEATL
ncbi:MAG TPA: glycosyltransferase family 9 protein [Opitutus sp.]|nr:glycosyltransferase family 9 protein [Opitutus sp.]